MRATRASTRQKLHPANPRLPERNLRPRRAVNYKPEDGEESEEEPDEEADVKVEEEVEESNEESSVPEEALTPQVWVAKYAA